MPFFGQFGERGIGGHFKVRKIQNNWSNLFMCNFLDCVRYCIGETHMSILDFVDWLGS